MVVYHSSEVVRKLVTYIEIYYPGVPVILSPEDSVGNRERGYMSGQPDVLVIEPKCRYMGLAIWATPWAGMTKSELRFQRRLSSNSYHCVASDVYDDLQWGVMEFMSGCERKRIVDRDRMEVMDTQMEVIETQMEVAERKNAYNFSLVRECNPLTSFDYKVLRALTEYFNNEDPTAVIIPGVGVDGQPDLTIISPDLNNDGVAIWLGSNKYFGCRDN